METYLKRLGFDDLLARVDAGERLSAADGLRLMCTPQILAVGALADRARRRMVGNRAHYSRYLNLNYSNICIGDCKFCAFARHPGDSDAYTLTATQVEERIREAQVDEVHIVGGLHPRLGLADYEAMLKCVKTARPGIFVKAFTAVEVDHIAHREKLGIDEVLSRLKTAGLDSMPGGGAEIFSPRVRALLCPTKLPGQKWLDVMETAHRLGIPSNATMLYGHLEHPEERVDHLLKIRELQDRSGGFKAFVPLTFHPQNTRMNHLPPPGGFENLRVIAVARLLLDNVPHVKALWMFMGLKMAQVALHFGADDLGGTAFDEEIVRAAGADAPDSVSWQELERVIREAGREPLRTHSGYPESMAESGGI